ncbi:Hint domain-containing protein [Gemmobacter lutimaris]|nr:Hint domain-containing protein [Gemmobacter lutimaris]
MTDTPTRLLPGQACMVFPADAVYVAHGVNMGDGLAPPEDICPGDVYELEPGTAALRLVVARSADAQQVAQGSDLGSPGDPVRIVARYTLMGDDANRVELLLLALGGTADGLFALPLSPMAAGLGYTLVKIEDAPEDTPLADLLCVSFARGTMITMADGSQRAIETLATGDRVLTRDHGPQPVRWVGHATLRAVGAFAPVVITAGAMGNAGDLIVSQHHRMFLYQRQRLPGLPTSELLVQAKHLVNDETIFLREGAFVDFFSLVFERHEIIYAEGVPAESLMVTEAVVNRLPVELSAEVRARFPGLSQNQHFGTEAGRQELEEIGLGRRESAGGK